MITIEQAGRGYKVRCSPGVTGARIVVAFANDLPEVSQAVQHWYGGAHGAAPVAHCPLCRLDTEQKGGRR